MKDTKDKKEKDSIKQEHIKIEHQDNFEALGKNSKQKKKGNFLFIILLMDILK